MLEKNTKSTSSQNFLQKFHFGELSTSSFYISITAGIGLAFVYNPNEPLKSISLIITTDYTATLFRNLHYWSSHLFLIFTLFHSIDHIIRNSDKKVKPRIWFHITISIILVFYLMLSGFILKGDYESNFAYKIFNSLLQSVPLIGKQISFLLLGDGDNFQLIYIHHIATSTIILLLIVIEHSKLFFPRAEIFLIAFSISFVVSLIFTPTLVDEFSNLVKGPWYFIGIQEILHNLSEPFWLVLILICLSILFYLIKFTSEIFRKSLLSVFVFVLVVYFTLSVIGSFFRGESWQWSYPSFENLNSKFEVTKFFSVVDEELLKTKEIKFINNRAEGCLSCHSMEGLTQPHNPDSIGCFSCHRGNPFTLNKNSAHKNLIRIPGNLDDAKQTCGNSNCHPDLFFRVNNSIMTTMSGVVSVDKFVFDELKSPSGIFRITEIGHSPAEKHLRNLCASCHLSNQKSEFGKINQQSRGGGCLACHLNYSKDAENQLKIYQQSNIKAKNLPVIHPSIDLRITNEHCFGCHSRSGRISTNYEGWSEILQHQIKTDTVQIRKLEDGRVFIKQQEDVHHKAEMDCIDCHISLEIMGDGNLHSHKEEQGRIHCEDCHSEKLNIVDSKNFDYETNKILNLRGFSKDTILLGLTGSKITFTNKIQIENNKVFLITKNSNRKLELKKAAPECITKAHENLTCQSCHTSWITSCTSCHTYFDKNEEGFDWLENKFTKGSWLESANEFNVDKPVLGIIKDKNGKEKITTFIPGMIIKISSENFSKPKFKRLFAPAFSHTITKKSIDCKTCHLNPYTLGFGKGKINFSSKQGKIKLTFTPSNSLNPIDLLPNDAWIGFEKSSPYSGSTRPNAKPLDREKILKILRVGLCLTCHKENSELMKKAQNNFDMIYRNRTKKCLTLEF